MLCKSIHSVYSNCAFGWIVVSYSSFFKLVYVFARILQDKLFLARILQDKLFLARSCKINFFLQESCKILQDKLLASTRGVLLKKSSFFFVISDIWINCFNMLPENNFQSFHFIFARKFLLYFTHCLLNEK